VEYFRVDESYREDDPVPNSKDHGRRDYGTRAGYWRLVDILDEYDVPATVALNAEVCDHQPRTVEAALDRDWAIMGHGITNSHRLVEMDRETQRKTIEETRDRISDFTGDSPSGWLSPGLMGNFDTLELLQRAGFDYLCDWCVDDQPFDFDNGLVGVPYSLDLNDKGLYGRQGLTGSQYRDAILDACETLRTEGQQPNRGRVLPIPLHPHITGQSFRAPYLEEALSEIADHDDVWMTTGDAIADHYLREYQ
jgi:peptidoglycan/xylan/chitin deacetylase (PgdA/CDA1 family)